ncbi:hypothetical protein [Acidovorax lacteus]|uniref:Lipoprotein SmpA/OmlA domain-containing protein n=1 Tax=Acidovorax lacteus TaxID=1924988 RepID=A0ABP8LAU0_9BURK
MGAAALALLLGCASAGRMPLGTTDAAVKAQLGSPTSRTTVPEGERWLYSQLPSGSEAHALSFDAAGRLVRIEQVLTAAAFEALLPGQLTEAQALDRFGPPLRVERVARFDGDVWTYRFKVVNDLRLAHLHFDRQRVLRQMLYTDELPLLADPRD